MSLQAAHGALFRQVASGETPYSKPNPSQGYFTTISSEPFRNIQKSNEGTSELKPITVRVSQPIPNIQTIRGKIEDVQYQDAIKKASFQPPKGSTLKGSLIETIRIVPFGGGDFKKTFGGLNSMGRFIEEDTEQAVESQSFGQFPRGDAVLQGYNENEFRKQGANQMMSQSVLVSSSKEAEELRRFPQLDLKSTKKQPLFFSKPTPQSVRERKVREIEGMKKAREELNTKFASFDQSSSPAGYIKLPTRRKIHAKSQILSHPSPVYDQPTTPPFRPQHQAKEVPNFQSFVNSIPHSFPQSIPHSFPQSIPHSFPRSIPHSFPQSIAQPQLSSHQSPQISTQQMSIISASTPSAPNIFKKKQFFALEAVASPKENITPAFFETKKVEVAQKIKKEDFKIGNNMGKGQFGEVILVQHKKTGFICGMKIMSKKQIREEKYESQIARELSIQFYLNHRNILQLYGFFEDESNMYLLLQFCVGGQLLQMLRKVRRMEQCDVSPIIKEIGQGVQYVHVEKIIHRDIKPENILFNFGCVKIADFGWAVHRGFTKRMTTSGSPLYYSPQVVNEAPYDEKIDIWAIGMMTYECLIGKIPFSVYSEMDLKRIVTDQVKFPDYVDVSKEAKEFILGAMEKQPQNRTEIKMMLRHPFITKYSNKIKIENEDYLNMRKVIEGKNS